MRYYLPKEYIQAPAASNFSGPDRRRKGKKSNSDAAVMFDPDKGLMYTGGNIEAYREILEMYAKKGPEKKKYIDELFEKKDWKNYIIEVHALKSTSLSIGAVKLSELAKELEAAGKAKCYGTIEKKNSILSDMYGEIIDIVNDYLGESGTTDNDADEEITELTEISAEKLSEYVVRAKEACGSFDGDAMTEIAKEAAEYSYNGKPLKEYFGRAAKLAEDFEYDNAAEDIARLETEMEAGV